MPDIFDQYQELWRIAEDELGIALFYDGSIPDGEGWFHHNPHQASEPSPTIRIGRPYYVQDPVPSRHRCPGSPLPPPDLIREMITLAHEMGHHTSWRERTPRAAWEAYFETVQLYSRVAAAIPLQDTAQEFTNLLRQSLQATLSQNQMQLILNEEATAWEIGREFLERVGFEHLDRYDFHISRGLHYHRYRLGLEELWPEDTA